MSKNLKKKRMKGKITKLVSIEYDSEEEKKRAEETFKMFESVEGAEVRNE